MGCENEINLDILDPGKNMLLYPLTLPVRFPGLHILIGSISESDEPTASQRCLRFTWKSYSLPVFTLNLCTTFISMFSKFIFWVLKKNCYKNKNLLINLW